jgi:hypothetical protein
MKTSAGRFCVELQVVTAHCSTLVLSVWPACIAFEDRSSRLALSKSSELRYRAHVLVGHMLIGHVHNMCLHKA